MSTRSAGGADAAVVSGTVTYRPRIALAPDAVVRVWVQDVSRAGAPTTIAEQTVATGGRQVPIPFAIRVAPQRVAPDYRYAVRAEIRGEGTLLWTTPTAYPVALARAQQTEVAIVVVQPPVTPAGEGVGTGTESTATAAALVGLTWRLVRIEPGDGRAVTPAAQKAYTIAFDTTGRYGGQAHCNRYGGEYRARPNGTLELRQGLSTLAACPSPSSANAFLGVLNAVTTFGVAGDTLRLMTPARGALVFRRPAGG